MGGWGSVDCGEGSTLSQSVTMEWSNRKAHSPSGGNSVNAHFRRHAVEDAFDHATTEATHGGCSGDRYVVNAQVKR